jgi:hypothetical protein
MSEVIETTGSVETPVWWMPIPSIQQYSKIHCANVSPVLLLTRSCLFISIQRPTYHGCSSCMKSGVSQDTFTFSGCVVVLPVCHGGRKIWNSLALSIQIVLPNLTRAEQIPRVCDQTQAGTDMAKSSPGKPVRT